jgi:uncharacterized RDD family membrane protein YckC
MAGSQQIKNTSYKLAFVGKIIASRKKRLLNEIIDLTFISFLFSINLAIYNYCSLWTNTLNFNIIFKNYEIFILILTYFFYYLLYEFLFNKTVGKFLTKTLVVSITGTKPKFWEILIRTFGRLIIIDFFTFFKNYPIGFHDKISETLVIEPSVPNASASLARTEYLIRK